MAASIRQQKIRIAVIGGGAGAREFLIGLLDLGAGSLAVDVKVFEPRPVLGRGAAWSQEKTPVLANLRAETLGPSSLHPELLQTLLVEMNHPEAAAEYPTRNAVGEALDERWRRKTRDLPSGWTIEHVRAEAVDVLWEQGSAVVKCSDDRVFTGFHYVLLAVGNLRTAPPEELRGSPRYINGWDVPGIEQIAPECDVLIRGSGLTAIDATLRLLEAGPRPQGSIVWQSRTGALPFVRPRHLKLEPEHMTWDRLESIFQKLAAERKEPTLDLLMRLFELESMAQSRKEAGRFAAGSDFAGFLAMRRLYRDPARGKEFLRFGLQHAREVSLWFSLSRLLDEYLIPFLWNHLPDFEKAVFLEEHRREFDRLWAPTPEPNGRRILDWLESGAVQLLRNAMRYEPDEQSGKVRYDRRLADPLGERSKQELQRRYKNGFDYVIEACGIPADLTRVDSALVRNLLARNTLTPFSLRRSDETGFMTLGAKVDWRSGAVLAADGQPHGWLYALAGSLTTGALRFTNSYKAVAVSAQWAAGDLFRRLMEIV